MYIDVGRKLNNKEKNICRSVPENREPKKKLETILGITNDYGILLMKR